LVALSQEMQMMDGLRHVPSLLIYGDHLAWPLVVGALLGKRREEPSPRHLLSFRAPTVPAHSLYSLRCVCSQCKPQPSSDQLWDQAAS
jgi:hypothetical protein